MSLKPRRIIFDQVWGCLRKTVEEVITLKNVNRDDWNNSFKWVSGEENLLFCFSRRWLAVFLWHNFLDRWFSASAMFTQFALHIRILWPIDFTPRRKCFSRAMSRVSWRTSTNTWWRWTTRPTRKISCFTITTALGRTTARASSISTICICKCDARFFVSIVAINDHLLLHK